jgi:hypothetical protein
MHATAERKLPHHERRALLERHKAAMHVIRTEPTSKGDRYALLAAVVAPRHETLLALARPRFS